MRTSRVIVASPDYVARRGEPESLNDLQTHSCISYLNVQAASIWQFLGDDGTVIGLPMQGCLATNNGEAMRDMVIAGLGIALPMPPLPIGIRRRFASPKQSAAKSNHGLCALSQDACDLQGKPAGSRVTALEGQMGRWIILATGVLLTANGFYTRTYDFPNETPVRYCFNMDYIGIDGCFYNATIPMLLAWVPFLIGLALIAWSILRALRKSA